MKTKLSPFFKNQNLILCFFLFILFIIVHSSVFSQYTVDFEGTGETKTGYASGTVTLNGIDWDLTETLIGTASADYKVGSRSLRIRALTGAGFSMLANKPNGVGTISFKYRRYDTDPQSAFKVQYSTNNGVDWSNAGSEFTGTNTVQTFSHSLNTSGNIRIRIVYSSGTTGNSRRLNIDDITMTDYVVTPTISTSGTLSALSTTYGTASSNSSFSVSGANMSAGILVTPPAGFEVSQSAGSGFGATTTVGSSGTIASTTVYVRLAATTAPGTYSGNIVLSSSGASNVNVATVSSTVNTKALTISGLSGANKVYDGNTTASTSGTASLVGIVGSDVVSLSGTPNFSFATASVGDGKSITASGYTLSGTHAARYTVSQPTGLTGNITTKSLTITANNVTKTAGALLTGGSGSTAFSSSGLVGSETIGTVTIAYGSAGATTGDGATPGVYTNQVTPSAATGGTFTSSNYSITYVAGSITVDAAPASPTISVSGTLDALSTTYGTPSSATSFIVSGAAMTAGITITPPTGFEVATTSDFSTTIGTNSSPLVIGSAGTIASTAIYVRLRAVATVLGSPHSGNITLTSTGASSESIATSSSTVSTKNLTISGMIAGNKVYDGTTSVSVTGTPIYVGLVNGESFSVTGSPSWVFATKTVGTAKTINRTGTYGTPSTNYTVTQPDLTADITAKSLTVSGASAQNKTYDGTTTATIIGASLVGVIGGDVVSVSGGGTFASANAANGISVSANLSISGADAGNYSLTQPTGLTANITKANQTITFGALADKTMTDSPFSLTATASSGLTVSYSSSNTTVATVSGSTVTIVGPGSTTITASQAGNTNYNAAADVMQTQGIVLSGYYWNGGSISANPANGGTGTWGTTNAWRQSSATGSQATWSNSNAAIFAGTAGTVTIGADYTCTAINVNTTNYTWTPNGTTTRALNGNVILANDVNLRLNDLTQTSNRTLEIGGNISGGTNSKITLLVNQTGTNTSRLNLASSGATLSVPVEISVGSTSSNYGNVAIVGTATNTVLASTFSLTNNTNYITSIGATSGNSLIVNGTISGISGLQFAAGSSGGAGIVNLNGTLNYSGITRFRMSLTGVIRASKANVFPSTTELDLGNGGNLGTFDLNGFDQEVAGLSSTSTSTSRGIVNTGVAATLTLSGDGDYVLNSLTGIGIPANTTNVTNANNDISISKIGSGTQEFQGTLTYTGLTTVSAGILRLNKSGGTTIPATNNVLVNGGTLQISKNQTLNNITVTSGTLRVDSGVTLTINGSFTGGGTIENNGTIVLVGSSTFPGSGTTVSAMNNLTINRTSGVSLDNSIEVTGTLTLTSGTLSVGANTLTLSGAYPSSNINNILTTASSSLVFNCTGSGPFALPTFTALGGLTINSSGQTYNLNSSPTISGNLTLTNGTLAIGARTLTYSGSSISRTSGVIDASNASANLTFANTSSVTIPSGTFSSNVRNLVLNGAGGVTLNSDATIPGALTLTNGVLTLGTSTLTLNTNSLSRTSGSIDASNTSATLVFSNASDLTLPTGIFSAAVNNLTLSNKRVVANNHLTVNGILNLNAVNPDATNGLLDLVQSYGSYADVHSENSMDSYNDLNSYVLTLGESSTVTGTGDVTGKIRRTSLSDGVTYAFGNANMTLRLVQNGGTLPSQITVVATRGDEGLHVDKNGSHDTGPNGLIGGAAVKRLHQVLRNGGTNEVRFTVRFPYSDSELNGNTESNLVTWDHHLPYGGMTPHEHGKTSINTTDNYVELADHGLFYLAEEGNTGFTKYWMLSDKVSADTLWLGAAGESAGTQWSNGINWSSGVAPSSWTKIVIDPTLYNNQLTLTGTPEAGTMYIKQGAVVNGGTSTLTLNSGPADNGGVGTWINEGTFNAQSSTVVINYADATIAGATDFNNLTINSDKKLTVQTDAVIGIKGALTMNGTFDATSNANEIKYIGSNQTIYQPNGPVPGYSGLTIAQSSGTATLGEKVTVLSNFKMNGGNLATSTANILEIGKNTSTTGNVNWTSGSVVGPMKRWFGTSANSTQASGIFPVGIADQNRMAIINFTETTDGGYIVMEYKTGAPIVLDENDQPLEDPFGLPLMYTVNGQRNYIQNADLTGYWDITPYSSAGVAYAALDANSFDITLRINSDVIQNNPVTANPPGMRIIRAKGNPGAAHNPFEIGSTTATITEVPGSDPGTDFYVSSNGLEGFSWFNIGGDNETPLPVELLSFNGVCSENGIELKWSTASEFNSDYFEIQKSTDGNSWRTIQTQTAAVISNSLLNYSFVDNEKTSAQYYRLNQVDINGDTKMYDPIFVDCEGNSTQLITYPNPSKGGFNIAISDSRFTGESTLIVRDAMGKVVLTKTISIGKGMNLFPIAANEIENGVYFITIESVIGESKVIKHFKN